jgi:murein L,D-transpeptidase YafK
MKKRTFLASIASGAVSGMALQPASAFGHVEDTQPKLHGKIYSGPDITQLLLEKSKRKLHLFHKQELLHSYRVRLGFNPSGHKFKQGDGRTPEGLYYLDRRNYKSRYHLSLGISYPNTRDVARARAAGVPPGGDIFIHGGPRTAEERRKSDWTAGCIALKDKDITRIFWMTRLGTPIFIAS